MKKRDALAALAALAQENRLDVFRLLVEAGPEGLPAGSVAAALKLAPNTLTFHFDRLRDAGLVTVRREGRSMIYAARFEVMNELLGFLTENCCQGATETCAPPICKPVRNKRARRLRCHEAERACCQAKTMTDRPFNVLFLCTGNSARSIMAEAILNKVGHGKFHAYSAGSQPKGRVNPNTTHLLQSLGYDTSGFRSKSWAEFAKPGAPPLDFVFTVCDNAAGETCPMWPGQPMTAHWGVTDPAEAHGTEAEIAFAFKDAYRMLRQRIEVFTALPVRSLDKLSLQRKLQEIGRLTDAIAKEPT